MPKAIEEIGLSVKVTKEDHEVLREMAEYGDRSMSSILRQAVKKAIADYRNDAHGPVSA